MSTVNDGFRYPTGKAWLLAYLKKYRGPLILGTIFEAASVAFGLQVPALVGNAIDDLGRAGVTYEKVWRAALIIIGVSIASGIFFFFQQRMMTNVSRYIEHDMRHDFYAHLQRMPLDFYQRQRIGDLMARATGDLAVVRQLAGQAIIYIERSLFRLLIVLPLMMGISVKLTLLLLVTMPLVSLTVKYFGQRIRARFEKVQEFFSEVTSRVQENLTGVRVVRAYAQERQEFAALDRLNREYVERNLSLLRLSAFFSPLLTFFTGLGYVAILWVGGREAARGGMTVGDFVAFGLYFETLIWPITAIGYITNVVQRGSVSLKRMHRVMATEPGITDAPGLQPAPEIEGQIEFRNLTLRYDPDGPAILSDIDLLIEPGQTVAFIGRTGAGKSTLLNLVPRVLDAEPGRVLIDGRPIREFPLKCLREKIGYVPQETFLFGDTLAENIAFGAPGASAAEVEWAAEVAGLAEDVEGFPRGFQTVIGERGITLSGGQKQRTGIARAVIRRPRILILDDALSAVDAATEGRILARLREAMRGRTTLIASHRVSTIKDADLICVLDHGRIIMRGSHEELLRWGGEYAELFERQSLEEELASP